MSHTMSDKRVSNTALKSPSPYQLRALVLDYLSYNCYGATARAFLRESTVKELDADGVEVYGASGSGEGARGQTSKNETLSSGSPSSVEDRLMQIEHRRGIRERILAGEIEEAIDLLNRYFPSVLSLSSQHPSRSYASAKKLEETPETYTYTSHTSIEPSHLLLNLRIQAFTESCRTEPLDIPPRSRPASPSPGPDSEERHSEPGTLQPPLAPSSSLNGPTSGPSMDPAKLALLIQKTQKLNELVKSLPLARDREMYKKELTNVASLLAYTKPEQSAVARYLSWERRVAVSDQVNRAILDRCGLAPISDIELAARYTTVLWGLAKARGVKPRAGILMPPRSSDPPRPVPTTTKGDKADNKEPESEQLPVFDLTSFVRAKRS